MSYKVLVVVFGLLGCSLAVPLNQSYDPQDFYSSTRIVGGTEAPEGSAPHMVALVVGDIIRGLMCGGSLISETTVLTAAHCIEPMLSWTGGLVTSARAVMGTNRWSDENRTAQFSGYKIHPEYNRWTITNDIGYLTLTTSVVLDDRVKTIALNFKWTGGGRNIYVTGWGTTTAWGAVPDRLQMLHVKTLSPARCKVAVEEAQQLLAPSPPMHWQVEICTAHQQGAGKGMCHGDSGSPLVDSRGRQVGIVSWGWPCAIGGPDIHARISAFVEFLQSLVESEE